MWQPEVLIALISALIGGVFVELIKRIVPSSESKSADEKSQREELWEEVKRLREQRNSLQETLISREQQFVTVKEQMIKECNLRVDHIRQTFYEMQEQYYQTRNEAAMLYMEVRLYREKIKLAVSREDFTDLGSMVRMIDNAKFSMRIDSDKE